MYLSHNDVVIAEGAMRKAAIAWANANGYGFVIGQVPETLYDAMTAAVVATINAAHAAPAKKVGK